MPLATIRNTSVEWSATTTATIYPGNVGAIPDLITTTKLKKFAYQEEYRFAYTRTDAFKFENVEVRLVDRKARPAPKPDEHFHETLDLGDLHDICRIRVS